MSNLQQSFDCLLAFGSNLGDGPRLFQQVLEHLAGGLDHVRVSALYLTRAIGPGEQPPYLNAAIRGRTSLAPSALLHRLLQIELELGRTRVARWGPRTVDLDLLLYGESRHPAEFAATDLQPNRSALPWPTSDSAAAPLPLEIPHPRLSVRQFVLRPACDIAADWWHPVCHATLGELLSTLTMRPSAFATTDRAIWECWGGTTGTRSVSADTSGNRDGSAALQVIPLPSDRQADSAVLDDSDQPVHRPGTIDAERGEDLLRFGMYWVDQPTVWSSIAARIKLLVVRTDDPHPDANWSIPWRGPRLALPSRLSAEELRAEIGAALAASSPRTVVGIWRGSTAGG